VNRLREPGAGAFPAVRRTHPSERSWRRNTCPRRQLNLAGQRAYAYQHQSNGDDETHGLVRRGSTLCARAGRWICNEWLVRRREAGRGRPRDARTQRNANAASCEACLEPTKASCFAATFEVKKSVPSGRVPPDDANRQHPVGRNDATNQLSMRTVRLKGFVIVPAELSRVVRLVFAARLSSHAPVGVRGSDFRTKLPLFIWRRGTTEYNSDRPRCLLRFSPQACISTGLLA
jgi:hypothetical protein